MIALTAYGIRKAYKKQQAKKAQKEQQERESQSLATHSHSDELRSASSSSSYRPSVDLHPHPASGGLVNYEATSPSDLTLGPSPSSSRYSKSVYSQKSFKDPLEEMRQYRAYIQRQSYDFGTETSPPSYEYVVGHDTEVIPPWKSGLNIPGRTESLSEIRESRHIPQDPHRVIELDTSSESSRSTSQRVPLRLFHPRSPVFSDHEFVSPATELPATELPATELPASFPEHIVSPILDDELQASLDEIAAEVPPPLKIRKSMNAERYELPAEEVTAASIRHKGDHETQQQEEQEELIEPERQQLKRARSESESEVESEDNEKVIFRINVADRTKRPYPKRLTVAD